MQSVLQKRRAQYAAGPGNPSLSRSGCEHPSLFSFVFAVVLALSALFDFILFWCCFSPFSNVIFPRLPPLDWLQQRSPRREAFPDTGSPDQVIPMFCTSFPFSVQPQNSLRLLFSPLRALSRPRIHRDFQDLEEISR